MLVPGTWTWADTFPVIVVALALLFVPGLVLALLLRTRVALAFGLAPALSTGMIALGGIVFGALREPWTVLAVAITVAGIWVLAGAFRLVTSRVMPAREPVPDEAAAATDSPQGWLGGRVAQTIGTLGGTAFAFAFFAWLFVRSSGSPEAFPQQPDTIFHLALPQWMLENGDISFFHSQGFSLGVEGGGYPIGLHDMTATLSLLTGAPVVVSTSAFVLVVGGIAWPLGMAVLARALLGARPEVGAVGAATSVLFTAYPFLQVVLGVLWPNFFGQALMPGLLAATVVAVRAAFPPGARRAAIQPAVMVVLAVPGLALAHFNALVAFLVFAWLVTLVGAARHAVTPGGRARWVPLALGLGAAAGGVLVSRRVAPAGMLQTGAPGPEKEMTGGLVDTLFFSPHGTQSLIVLSALVVVGSVLAAWRHREALWAVFGCAAFMALYFINVTIDEPWTRTLTWPWYNISHRLAAVGVLPAVVLVTVALIGVAGLVGRRGAHRHLLRGGTAVALLVVLVVGTGGYRQTKFAPMDNQFHPKDTHSWASPEELRALRALSREVPEDAVVAADPWNGGTYLYVVSGRQLLWPTEKANNNPDRQLLGLELDEAGEDPAVCAAAERQDVRYAITGGQHFAWARPAQRQLYAGVNAVGSSPAWEVVATEEPYTLYRLTACAA